MMTCPECGSENVNRYKHYDECLDCLHRKYHGPKRSTFLAILQKEIDEEEEHLQEDDLLKVVTFNVRGE